MHRLLYSMRHGVSSRRRRRVRVHGGRAAAAARRPPRDRGRARHRRLATRARRSATLYPSLGAAYPGLELRAVRPGRRSRGLDLVFLALPHGESRQLAAAARRRRRRTWSTSAPTSGCRPTTYAQWYGETHTRARADRPLRVRAASSCTATTIAAHAHVASPGLLPDRGEPRAARRSSPPGSSSRPGSSSTRCRRLGRGPRAEDARASSPRPTRASRAYGLLTHRHTAEMEQALTQGRRRRRSQVLFTPHLVPMMRGIHATCYARPAVAGLSTASLLEHYREFYADEPCVVRGRRAVGHEGDVRRATSCTSRCASTSAPARCSRSA